MRKIIAFMTFLLIAAATVYYGGARAAVRQPSKPVHEEYVYTYFKEPPDSLSQMMTDVDAVVVGRVSSGSPREVARKGEDQPHLMTAHSVAVTEILRYGSYPINATELVILREGGDKERAKDILRVVEARFPPFHPGEYVLFLKWNTALNAWMPAWGPNGVFYITNGQIDSPGTAPIVRSQKGKKSSDFVDTLRQGGKK